MPSIIDGLFSGRSGIQAHGTAISVLADNIANQNTVGFKAARADFVDLLAGSLGGGGATSTGSGSAVKTITRVLTQGTFEFTGRGLDVGIDGNGFLLVRDTAGTTYYTRAGNLSVDADGLLRDQNGLLVLGYSANGSGAITPLNVTDRVAGDIATSRIALGGNLNSDTPVTAPLAAGATYAELNDAAGFAYSFTAFDSLGGQHNMRAYFFKTDAATRTWTARVYVDGGDVTTAPPSTPGIPVLVGTVPLVFGNNGQLTTPTDAIQNSIAINWSNGAAPSTLQLDFARFTQYSSPSNIDSSAQNGTGSGSVVGYSVSPDGSLEAQLDNGQRALVGTIALASFANSEGLRRVGNSLFAQSRASGEPIIGSPNVGTFGRLESGALELSTSDLASDFIKLISLQRGFQGSSRVVGSISDLLNEVVNLAR
ncbi:MAG TPA: flagellar hook protein FlgE [Oligoflexia bacterium]|nr:flagellar hook protein FlgE [Oligoflexia bacterium]HMP48998.1 flagellar hook protein FlgE [Oligoflexia bacterium]